MAKLLRKSLTGIGVLGVAFVFGNAMRDFDGSSDKRFIEDLVFESPERKEETCYWDGPTVPTTADLYCERVLVSDNKGNTRLLKPIETDRVIYETIPKRNSSDHCENDFMIKDKKGVCRYYLPEEI
tara:strand:- start:782 stop:1159 length:378 start_codon:yes stop_codon:yes gene_type:complete